MIEFEIVGEVSEIKTIAVGPSVRDRRRLRKQYGRGRWRKLKGIANVRLVSGRIRLTEIHRYDSKHIWRPPRASQDLET